MKRSFRSVLLAVLWLAWFVLLPCTFVAIVVTGDGSWSRFWWLSSAVLVMAAWGNWFFCRRDRLGLFFGLIALGMTLGMLADLYGAFGAIRFTEPLVMIVPLFALALTPTDRTDLVEQILASFEFPGRKDVDAAWAREVLYGRPGGISVL